MKKRKPKKGWVMYPFTNPLILHPSSLVLLLLLCQFFPLIAQNQEGLIYGRITTVDEKEYVGLIRWGIEEAFWDDLFTARKIKAEALTYLSPQVIKEIRQREEPSTLRWDFMSLWENPYPNLKPFFRCRFGDLKSMEVTGESSARLTFKDNSSLEVEGGNDIGSKVYVYDREGEQSRLEWDRIDRIEFMRTPDEPFRQDVTALYGTVWTTQGAFKGYIQWDDEECLSSDQLEGKDQRGKHSFPFGEVAEIKVEAESARVSLFSGREYVLGGTDDLSNNNHGIIVKHMELGRVHIPWEEFRFVHFEEEVQGSGPGYTAFTSPKALKGRIETTEGQTYEGRMIFDLDEQLDLETIEGEQEGVRYFLPLRNIARIQRRNHQYCAISLLDGDKLFLGEAHDVTDKNWGMVVWTNERSHPIYIPWEDVNEIEFER